MTHPDFTEHSRMQILLGAGASHEGGSPLSQEITKRLLDTLGASRHPAFSAEALRFVCGALIKYDVDRGGSPTDLPDIERLVSAVELLADRNTLEVSAFVGSWDPMVDRLGEGAKPSFPAFFDQNLRTAIQNPRQHGGAERLIREAIRAEMGTPNKRVFGDLHRALVHGLREQVHIPRIETFDYLQPLIQAAYRSETVTITTLNYDLSVEGQAQRMGLHVVDGIEEWTTGAEFSWGGESCVRLLKVHGSVGWSVVERPVNGDVLAEERVIFSGNPLSDPALPAVVFGQREKLRAKGPFLTLFGEFVRMLDTSDLLVVIGYAFRDGHVNEVIRRWLNRNPARKLVVVDPYFPTEHSYPTQVRGDDLQQELMWAFVPRAHQAASVPSERLTVIREPASSGIARLFGHR